MFRALFLTACGFVGEMWGQSATYPGLLRFAQAGTTVPQSQTVALEGTGSYSATAFTTSGGGWLQVTPSSGTLPATLTVTIAANSLQAGLYSGFVNVNVGGSLNSVPVLLAVFATGPGLQIFTDVAGDHVWLDSIYLLRQFAITLGCNAQPPRYCPGGTVSQGEMAAFIIRAIAGESFAYSNTPYFTDVAQSDTFFKYIQKMKELGIHTGCGNNQYCPATAVTRGQMAQFIVRARFGENFTYTQDPRFPADVPSSHPLFKYVQKMWELGVTQGCTDTQYCVNQFLSREQMAVFLARAFFRHSLLPSPTPTPPPAPTPPAPTRTPPSISGCDIFPYDNVWNTPIEHLSVHARSTDWVNTIGSARTFHADFGSGTWNGGPIGIPFIVVPQGQAKVPVTFDYDDESDPGPYPVPPNPPIEGGPNSDGDRHILVIEQGVCKLWELYAAYPQGSGYSAGSGAIYDLKANGPLRPSGWTSADAAGLPLLPGLVRYDEVAAGEIKHAIRFTAPVTKREFLWPARHFASSQTGSQYPPMGARFRLKASFDISSYSQPVQVILRAMKKYGIILADNGSAWYISGAPDERWNNDLLRQMHQIPGSAIEAVDASPMMINVNSGQARQP
ncbi:MAG: S-layer homology domain-containing protein [Bryobacteraceae bacterium]